MAYVACVMVNIVTLIGVFFTLPVMKKLMGADAVMNKAYIAPTDTEISADDVEAGASAGGSGGHGHGSGELEGLFAPWVLAYSSAFSAGAILSTTFMLVVPEAIGLIWKDKGGIEEIELEGITWMWGTCLLAGFLFPYVLGALVHPHLPQGNSDSDKKVRCAN